MSSNERGFPKPTKNLNLGKISPAVRTEPVKSLQSSVQFQDSVKDDEIDDYGENNLKQVLSMSPEEVEASVAQLSTMFSSKNLDFLRTRGAGLIAQKHDSNISTPQYSEDKGCIARDAHELEEKVKHAPPHIRRALQWTLDGDDQNSTTDEASSANLPKLTSSPRFDLQGCRIIHSGLKDGKSTPTSTTLSEWDEVLQKSFVGRWLSVNEIHSLAQLAISKFLDCGYVVELPAGDNETWIPELEHHEFEQGKPGYNLLEICEVYFHLLIYMTLFSFYDQKFLLKGKLGIES